MMRTTECAAGDRPRSQLDGLTAEAARRELSRVAAIRAKLAKEGRRMTPSVRAKIEAKLRESEAQLRGHAAFRARKGFGVPPELRAYAAKSKTPRRDAAEAKLRRAMAGW